MNADLLIQRGDSTAASKLLLLFHGVGSNAEDLRPLGRALAAGCPQACIVSVRAPDPSDFGQGWQWFSVKDVTEVNRSARVAAAMPRFVGAVRAWQSEMGIGATETTLIGFSQGAIMALESTQQSEPVAANVIAIAGRFAQPPRIAPKNVVLHLLHGEQDRVMPATLAVDGTAQWRALGGTVTLDMLPNLGHGIDASVMLRAAGYLECTT